MRAQPNIFSNVGTYSVNPIHWRIALRSLNSASDDTVRRRLKNMSENQSEVDDIVVVYYRSYPFMDQVIFLAPAIESNCPGVRDRENIQVEKWENEFDDDCWDLIDLFRSAFSLMIHKNQEPVLWVNFRKNIFKLDDHGESTNGNNF
jgi:hypothetical protein